MKFKFCLLVLLLTLNSFSQSDLEKTIKSEVDEVTVFLKGAQVTRQKSVSLPKGESILKFTNLSPFIDAKSIQVKAKGELMVLSVNRQLNYLDELEKSAELTHFEKELEKLDLEADLENAYLSVVQEEIKFLEVNRAIGGKNDEVSLSNLQQVAGFYGKKLTELKIKELERKKTLREIARRQREIENQMNTLSSKKDYPVGEILVKVDAKRAGTFDMELKYLVANAGWYPTYDIRAKNISEPVQLVYKANVKQDTKIDWKNVKLKFSSAEPNVSGLAPELQPYFINYNTIPPNYKTNIKNVQGTVNDSDGLPLPGANVTVAGTTIQTTTDFDGKYSISIPNNAHQLVFSYVGFITQTIPITNAVMNVSMREDASTLDEVVVVGYGSRSKKRAVQALEGQVAGVNVNSSMPIPTAQVENQTTVDFEINTPYSIKSDNQNYTVEMETYNLPADYQYFSVPKIDKDAFLLARIQNWEKYNLLEGEANIFFEGTYVGKTLMDVRYASDTLEISLGRDKQVSVNREKVKDFTDKQFIGNKKEETRAYKISVKNNKSQSINLIILDQVPVSSNDEIQVSVQEKSKAKIEEKTGEVKWEFSLEPGKSEEFELKYSVKYPKNRRLILD
jgi:hypothetical protein